MKKIINENRVVELYLQGITQKIIAQRFGVSEGKIHKILDRHGLVKHRGGK